MSHGTLLNIFIFINIVMLFVTPPAWSMVVEDDRIDKQYKVNSNTGLPSSLYDAFRTRFGKVSQSIDLNEEQLNPDLQSRSLYDEYKKEIDKFTNIQLNDKTSASSQFLRWAQAQPLHYSTGGTLDNISHNRRSPNNYDYDFTNGHGRYDCVYEEFKRRLDDLKSTYCATNKERCLKYDLKKQAPNVRLDIALHSLGNLHQKRMEFSPERADVEFSKIVDKEKDASLNDLEEFQNEVKQKILNKRAQFQKVPMYVESLYDELKRRIDKYTTDLSQKFEPPNDHEFHTRSLKYDDDSPIYSKPGLYEIRRIQNSLQPNGIREKFYEEYRKNQPKTSAELCGKDNGCSERGARYIGPNDSQQTTYKTKKSIPIVAYERSYVEESSYPAVLTKALESSLNPYTSFTPKSLLTTVAQKMNTTPLELAHKLTNPTDLNSPENKNNDNVKELVQKYIESSAAMNRNATQRAVKPSVFPVSAPVLTRNEGNTAIRSPDTLQQCVETPHFQNCEPVVECAQPSYPPNIKDILEKLLTKLETMQIGKVDTDGNIHSEGAPCELIGSWNSLAMGLRFEIEAGNNVDRTLASVESGNTLLNIEAVERIPEREHTVLDSDWCFMSSAVKTLGGPFYIYTQSPQDREIATFVGYCRTCGGIDTIFGSWTLLHPSNDCQDITASLENKRDIMRRNSMIQKRKERYKDILFNNSQMSHAKEGCRQHKKS